MKVCIAGGGRVGRYLAQSLLANHHSVVIIEPVEAQCRMLADQLDIPVICGDSINMDTLRSADAASCDAFVAVTGSDEDNLIACQIAKREFGVDRTVARASNPKNRELLHTLGVDTVVCGTDNLSHILEREIETDTIRQLLSLGGGTASLNEILLPENFLYAGKAIMDIPIPGDAILVSITRDTELIIPHGNTTLLPWDRILLLTQDVPGDRQAVGAVFFLTPVNGLRVTRPVQGHDLLILHGLPSPLILLLRKNARRLQLGGKFFASSIKTGPNGTPSSPFHFTK